jgi:hypothetical protein
VEGERAEDLAVAAHEAAPGKLVGRAAVEDHDVGGFTA